MQALIDGRADQEVTFPQVIHGAGHAIVIDDSPIAIRLGPANSELTKTE